MTELTDQERRALADFIGEHWAKFIEAADAFLDREEIEALGHKLDQST